MCNHVGGSVPLNGMVICYTALASQYTFSYPNSGSTVKSASAGVNYHLPANDLEQVTSASLGSLIYPYLFKDCYIHLLHCWEEQRELMHNIYSPWPIEVRRGPHGYTARLSAEARSPVSLSCAPGLASQPTIPPQIFGCQHCQQLAVHTVLGVQVGVRLGALP